MRNEIKIELLQLMLRNISTQCSEEEFQDSGTFTTLYSKYRSAFIEQKDLISQNRQFLTLYKDYLKSLTEVKRQLGLHKKSWRFRTGNFLIGLIEPFLGIRKTPMAIDKIEDSIELLIRNFQQLSGENPEPAGFLNPVFWMDNRIFKDKEISKDASVSIIVLNHNGASHLQNLFESFLKFNSYENCKFIIVDHSSTDKSRSVIDHYSNFIKIDSFYLDQNLTFSYSNNLAVSKTNSEYLLFLNNDIIIQDDFLGKFIEVLGSSENNGIAGANLFFPAKSQKEELLPQHTGILFTREVISLSDHRELNKSGISNQTITSEVLKPYNYTGMPESEIVEFPAVTGAALMIRTSDFIRLNGFNENFIWGFEDVDLCLSCRRKLGKKILSVSSVRMIHDESATRKSHSSYSRNIQEHNLEVLNKNHGIYLKNKFLVSNEIIDNGPDNKGFFLKMAIKIASTPGQDANSWGDTHFANSLKKFLERKGCKVRVDLPDRWYSNSYLDDDVVLVLRGINRYYPRSGQINILWNISHPELVTLDEINSYDHVFFASSNMDSQTDQLSGHASSLLQCTDPELFFPEIKSGVPRLDYLFVGNSRNHYRQSVKLCVKNNLPLSVFGNNWQEFIPGNFISGTYIANEELRYYYSSCRILLNDHWKDMADSSLISNRLFDAIACGCVIISDHVSGIREIFGDSVLTYKSEEEFLKCIAEVESNYDFHKANAIKQSEIIRRNHSFENRADEILRVARNLIQKAL